MKKTLEIKVYDVIGIKDVFKKRKEQRILNDFPVFTIEPFSFLKELFNNVKVYSRPPTPVFYIISLKINLAFLIMLFFINYLIWLG